MFFLTVSLFAHSQGLIKNIQSYAKRAFQCNQLFFGKFLTILLQLASISIRLCAYMFTSFSLTVPLLFHRPSTLWGSKRMHLASIFPEWLKNLALQAHVRIMSPPSVVTFAVSGSTQRFGLVTWTWLLKCTSYRWVFPWAPIPGLSSESPLHWT